MNDTLLQDALIALSEGLSRPAHFRSAVVIVLALLGAWVVNRVARARLAAMARARGERSFDAMKFSVDGLRRLIFPVTALALMKVGSIVLRKFGWATQASDVRLLHLAMILMGALAATRFSVYVARRAFPKSDLIQIFERSIATIVWSIVALKLMGWLDDVVEWLREAQLPLGTSAVSLWDMGVATVTILGALVIALWIGATVEARLAKAETMDQNLRVVFSRLVRAALIVVALMIGLSVSGIEPTVLTVFGGTLGVGLGLGFQRIASNYVSGFIILLDRSLRIGDLITVDKYHGLVSQIRTRYTVLRALDGTEAIVPNEMLVSAPVTNLSYTDRRVRAAVKVSVAYQTDVKLALAMMEEAARGAARVLSDPPPFAMLLSFGADGLELEVGFWLADPEQGRMSVQSDVAQAILTSFRAAGIEIPYPQRDVRISGWNPGPSS